MGCNGISQLQKKLFLGSFYGLEYFMYCLSGQFLFGGMYFVYSI